MAASRWHGSQSNPVSGSRNTGESYVSHTDFFLLLLTALPAAAAPPEVAAFSDVSVHDPSLIRLGDEFYVFGSHLASASAVDWQHWTQITTDGDIDAGNVLVPDPATEFAKAIAWTQDNQAFFAPDVIQLADGRFYY